MSDIRESVVLCEGFYDRAFWKGWLLHLNCQDARKRRSDGTYDDAIDPFGKTVPRGQFGFHSPLGKFIRLEACNGDKNVRKAARRRLKQHSTQPLQHLIMNVDLDTAADDAAATDRGRKDLREWLDHIVEPALRADGVTATVVDWSAPDPPTTALPAKQTLERLVCAAISEVFPERARAVDHWLLHRPAPPPLEPKAFAWSHMAGWYATDGCDEFYQKVWRDIKLAQALTKRLGETGAVVAIEALMA